MTLPVYSRAQLSRTVALVVALLLMAVSTSAVAREFRAAEQTPASPINLNRTDVTLIGTFVPALNVLAMPFLFRSIEHLQKVLDGPTGHEIPGSFEPYGFVGPAIYDSRARSIYNSVRPVRSIADIEGLRLRVQRSELMSDMILSLGSEPVELPYGQVRAGLATKLIDENKWPSFVTDRTTFREAAVAGIYAKAQRDPAAAQLIERIRKVE